MESNSKAVDLLTERLILARRQAKNAVMLRDEARAATQHAKALEREAWDNLEAWDAIAREAGIAITLTFDGFEQRYGYGC